MSINIATPESLKLAETLKELLPNEGYCLMGIHEKTHVWARGINNLARTKPITVKDSQEKSAEILSTGQIGFFGNLHNCTKPENLNDFNLAPTMVDDEHDTTVKKLVLAGKKINKLGQTVIKMTAVIWREYTEEEKKEYEAKKAQAQAIDLGYTKSETDVIASLISGF
ncbi:MULTISPECIES: hypothetical protein [Bacteria]|uniref:hypothetical protein n=1 Tax=Bacteria TaxID=2 RepID=UPI003F36F471